MLLHDGPLCVKSKHLKTRSKGVHYHGKEQESTALEKAGSIEFEVVKDTGNDKSHNGVAEH